MAGQNKRGRNNFDNLEINGSEVISGRRVAAEAGAVILPGVQPWRKDVIRLDQVFSAAVLAANDFGSVKVATLPTTNMHVWGCRLDLVALGTGGVSDLSIVDVAIGTEATTETDFSAPANADNIMGSLNMTAGGLLTGGFFVPAVVLQKAQTDPADVFINIGVVISTNGTVDFQPGSTITLFTMDLGTNP